MLYTKGRANVLYSHKLRDTPYAYNHASPRDVHKPKDMPHTEDHALHYLDKLEDMPHTEDHALHDFDKPEDTLTSGPEKSRPHRLPRAVRRRLRRLARHGPGRVFLLASDIAELGLAWPPSVQIEEGFSSM